MNPSALTLDVWLARGAMGAPAVRAPGREPLTHGELRALLASARAALRALGIGRGDRVAMVLPNGPVMATSFLAVAGMATAAPLNPSYREPEFEFYLEDLAPKILLVQAGVETAARAVAARCGVSIVELRADPAGSAGRFTLGPDRSVVARPAAHPQPGDVALVLHTSGTTSRPKLVPLSQANLCASGGHIAATLALTSADHCLNIMPLFHIHGLVAAVLASLGSGGSVTCTPGFNAMKFFAWCREAAPSWFTAVPTMHQAILERAPRNRDVVQGSRLRFIRSSSASLPEIVMRDLEATFGCPVIEAYGMTEAAHQMTSNPLPPAARKPGRVGVAAGPEVRLMDTGGNFVAPGSVGEIVIRGANVTSGYAGNPTADAAAFAADPDGGAAWFRTGDQGRFDADGYLCIDGRLKEIINRGGEKIAPREVDEVLLAHAAVAQAVTFAVTHPRLGEDAAAAVVLRPGAEVSEHELREFAGQRLARFKVPGKIVFVDCIPTGSTGKLQRLGLAKLLGLE